MATQPAFTEGPWVFHKRGQRIYGGSWQGLHIAQIQVNPKWEANAHLIAAAPDLLEALKDARAALHQHYVDWDGEPEDAVLLQLARSKCDAAIAKATGAQ